MESLRYNSTDGTLQVLDQLLVPHSTVWVDVRDCNDAWSVIRKMQVRGAPLIAVVAALGLAVEARALRGSFASTDAAAQHFIERMQYLRTSRPTAVNLFRATDDLSRLVEQLRAANVGADTLVVDLISSCESMLSKDVTDNVALGENGAQYLMELLGKDRLTVLTICNTGSLATCGYGTALGIVRSLHKRGALEHVYACETRPYNQGARLTAYECVQDGLPGTLICDSMAGALMRVKGVDCVIVGADRVCGNGDTANKIGTYSLGVLAKYHDVPLIVASPTSTLDVSLSSGREVTIEERPAQEMKSIAGIPIAPTDIPVWNPAFDITPGELVTAIVTERGVIERTPGALEADSNVFNVKGFLNKVEGGTSYSDDASGCVYPLGYVQFNSTTLGAYVMEIKKLRELLGATDASQLQIQEVGDGNLNLVFIVQGPAGAVVVKQALPYVRCVGEQWPLSLTRAQFEYNGLKAMRKLCSDLVPELYHFDRRHALFSMQFLAQHLVLRKHLIKGTVLPLVSGHLGIFLATTLFRSSALHLSGTQFREAVSYWSTNHPLCTLTESVVFTEPYLEHPNNRWTTPGLDNWAQAIRTDTVLKRGALILKEKFITHTQALLHGDIHTGSVMCNETETYVIDAEFAFYGPMGFDLGALIANLFIAYFASSSRQHTEAYQDWILQQIASLWNAFTEQFGSLWDDGVSRNGALYAGPLDSYADLHSVNKVSYLQGVLKDTLGFAGAKMIRRVVGIAHTEDLDGIEDVDLKLKAERRVLILGRRLVTRSLSAELSLGLDHGDITLDRALSWARELQHKSEEACVYEA